MVHKPIILLLAIFLGSSQTALAQTLAPLLAPQQVVPLIAMLPTVLLPLPAISLLLSIPPSPQNFSAPLRFRLARAYQRDFSLEHLSPMVQVRSLNLSQSSLPLVQFWAGRLELDAFQSSLHIQGGLPGLMGNAGIFHSSTPGSSGPFSVHLSGLSLTFRFARDARPTQADHLWQRLTRVIAAVLN